jgi:MoxR-like ATPase
MTAAPGTPDTVARVADVGAALVASIESVLAGKRDVAELAVACLLARGHLLIEDIPGVGKTLLAQVLSSAVGGTFHRIQGTVDLLPGDVTGTLMPDHDAAGQTLRMRFRPGPVFANVVLFDELNRTSPRTQSALLEAAEEGTVTVDGTTHRLPQPFFLVATQNPIDIAGTYRLGEGAVDRFAAVVSPGRAALDDEVAVLAGRRGRSHLGEVRPVVSLAALAHLQQVVDQVTVPEPVARYVAHLLDATRNHPRVRLGASTRGGLAVVGLARARAAMASRNYVVPDDVRAVATAGLAHRVLVIDSDGSTTAGRGVVTECLQRIRPPAV